MGLKMLYKFEVVVEGWTVDERENTVVLNGTATDPHSPEAPLQWCAVVNTRPTFSCVPVLVEVGLWEEGGGANLDPIYDKWKVGVGWYSDEGTDLTDPPTFLSIGHAVIEVLRTMVATLTC